MQIKFGSGIYDLLYDYKLYVILHICLFKLKLKEKYVSYVILVEYYRGLCVRMTT